MTNGEHSLNLENQFAPRGTVPVAGQVFANQTTCWNCKQKINYSGDKYCDVICPTCEILNSIYPHPETIKCSWCEAEVKINDETCPKCGSKVIASG